MKSTDGMLAGVELGGTKCICVLGTGPQDIRATVQVPTESPARTLERLQAILQGWCTEHGAVAAVGIASFGPLELRPESARYGRIVSSAKPGWSGTDLINRFADRFGVPVGLDTDVNGAALAEGRWGSARGLDNFAYVTVGTGVGVGLIVAGRPVLGFGHPELGHVRVARAAGDLWPGSCPFHGDCIEGLVSGPAIGERAGVAAEQLAPTDPVWEPVAFALGQLAHLLALATAPRRILIGGGVMAARPYLLERVRRHLFASLGGYGHSAELADLANYIAPPGLGTLSGPLGALALAADVLACRKIDAC